MAALGAGQAATAAILITFAARYAGAAEVNLLVMVEAVLGPVWVWLAVGETPTLQTIWGGAVVVLSVGIFAAARLKDAVMEEGK